MSRTLWLAGVISLLITGCGEKPASPVAAVSSGQIQQDSAASPCAKDDQRLALTGLCRSQAISALKMKASASPPADEGCEWTVMETQLPAGEVLLFRGLKCGARETRLEFAGGAHRAELQLAESAFSGRLEEPVTQIYVYTLEGDLLKAVADRAREATTSPEEAAGCTARPVRIEGWPGDAIIVDVSTAEAAKAPADEPRTACGPLGLNQGEQAFWRAGQGYGWFFSMGQDAFEIDPGSLTVITKGADGRWAAL